MKILKINTEKSGFIKAKNRFIRFVFLLLCYAITPILSKGQVSMEISNWKPLKPHLLGANANLVDFDKPWENDRLLKITEYTGIKTLRYPGGTIGNYWDWDIGAIDKNVPDSLMIKWVVTGKLRESSNRYTIENLSTLYHKTSIIPVFMLNLSSKDLEHSIRNLKKAAALGIPIKYIEMGNELYFNIPFPLLRFPTPESYGETCHNWIAALKEEFPEAKFAVLGTSMDRHARQVNWNKRVLEKCTNADAIVIHSYSPSGLDGRLEKTDIAPGSEGMGAAETASRKAPKDLAEKQKWELELLQDKSAYTNMFTTAQINLKKLDEFYVPENMELWVTEFNIRDDNSVVLHSWVQTLILSQYYLKFLEKNVSISNLHNLTGKLFGMIHTDIHNFDHLKAKNVISKPYTLSAGGIITQIFAKVMSEMKEGAKLNFTSVPLLTDDREKTFETIQGWAFRNENVKKAIIVNYGFEEQKIQLKKSRGTLITYHALPSSAVIDFEHIKTSSKTFKKAFNVPQHSISIIEFK